MAYISAREDGFGMLFQLLSWLMRSSEVVTNCLDLFAFILATPEIIGCERLIEIHDRLERLRADPRFAIPLIILILAALLFCGSIIIAPVILFVVVSPFYLVILIFGDPFASKLPVVIGSLGVLMFFCLTIFASVLVVMAFPNRFLRASFTDRESSDLEYVLLIIRRLYLTARYLVVNSPVLLTPRGMLFTALGLFLFSRLLSIAHALAAG